MFVPGLRLSELFYPEAVEPLLREHFGEVTHSAARIGAGSEVLGFDTERSADHEWGPRLQLFLSPEDGRGKEIVAMLADHLPKTFRGYPTNFVAAGDDHVRHMAPTDGPVYHRVDVTDLNTWFSDHLGFDPRGPITTAQWLATPTQTLAEATGGAVFHDGLNQLVKVRAQLAWYPDDVWRQVLARLWLAVAEEESFVGRCGEVGDELGSAVVAARQVQYLMRLCLVMGRQYPPYSKWLGSAFARCRPELVPVFTAVVAAAEWRERERHLARAYESVAALHNSLGLTDWVDPATRNYHDRPFLVLRAERFADALG
jgi:hypothetical protein